MAEQGSVRGCVIPNPLTFLFLGSGSAVGRTCFSCWSWIPSTWMKKTQAQPIIKRTSWWPNTSKHIPPRRRRLTLQLPFAETFLPSVLAYQGMTVSGRAFSTATDLWFTSIRAGHQKGSHWPGKTPFSPTLIFLSERCCINSRYYLTN